MATAGSWPSSPTCGNDCLLTRLDGRRLAKTAHAFGYRGHCLTKSRRYSTTFKALRDAREAFVHAQLLARSSDAVQRAITAAGERFASFEYVGGGPLSPPRGGVGWLGGG